MLLNISCFSGNIESISDVSIDFNSDSDGSELNSGDGLSVSYKLSSEDLARVNRIQLQETKNGNVVVEELSALEGSININNLARGSYTFKIRAYTLEGNVIGESKSLSINVNSYKKRFKVGDSSFFSDYSATISSEDFYFIDRFSYQQHGDDDFQYGWDNTKSGYTHCSPSLKYHSLGNLDKRHFCSLALGTDAFEIEVPNGEYLVSMGMGRAYPINWSGASVNLAYEIEGTEFYSFTWTPYNRSKLYSKKVTVSDGRLSVTKTSAASADSNFSYIELIDNSGNDYQAPSVPQITKTSLGTTGKVTWPRSEDNILVKSYVVFVNGTEYEEVESNYFFIKNMQASSTYKIQVAAKDFSDNLSDKSNEVIFKDVKPYYKIVRSSSAPTLDGDIVESSWSSINFFKLQNFFTGTASESENLVKFASQWDDSYLYFAMDIVDDLVVQTKGDFVEVYIEAKNNKSTDFHDFSFKLECKMDASSCVNTAYLGSSISGVNVYTDITDTNNASMEIAIPWSSLGVSPSSGMEIGMEVQYNDDDTDNSSYSREAGVFWYNSYDVPFLSPADWSVGVLE